MSGRRALLQSLLTLLTGQPPAGFGLTPDLCGLTSGGRPPATAGPWYYGLHAGGGRRRIGTSLIENPTVRLTITGRVRVGADKIGPALIEAEDGLDDRLEDLVRFVGSGNRDYAWFNAANALLGPDVNGFKFIGLEFSDSDPQEVSPDWFLAPAASTSPYARQGTPGPAGVKATLTISGFERERYVETVP